MSFRWTTSPEAAFIPGFASYQNATFNALHALMVEEAVRCEDFMRANAPWVDDCMPGREYLRAFAFIDEEAFEVGIIAYYDQEMYDKNCPKRAGGEYKFFSRHETLAFKDAGVISIILPGGAQSVLGDFAAELWEKVKALYAGGTSDMPTSSSFSFSAPPNWMN